MLGLEKKLYIVNFSLKLGKIYGLVEPLNYMEPGEIYEKYIYIDIFMARVVGQAYWEINSKKVKFIKPNLLLILGFAGREGRNLDPT